MAEKAREKYATGIDGLLSISVSITSTMQGLVTLASTRAGSFMLRSHSRGWGLAPGIIVNKICITKFKITYLSYTTTPTYSI